MQCSHYYEEQRTNNENNKIAARSLANNLDLLLNNYGMQRLV